MIDLKSLTILQAHKMLSSGKISSTELTKSVLDRISARQSVGAFITIDHAGAMEQAKLADKFLADNSPQNTPLLMGIPISVKDVISTKGLKTTAGSKILENYIPPYDATVVSKIRYQGGVILGKNNCDEFAMGSSTENSAYFLTKNPHDLKKIPGGSSGGSAAAVADNQSLLSIGTDTGGSIRQPAALCGVVGLKPSYGRVSRYGLIAMASSLDQAGPFTKDVDDSEAIFKLLSGVDPYDSTTREFQADFKPKNKLKIAIPKGVVNKLSPAVKANFELGLKKLSETHEITEISLPDPDLALAVYYVLMPSEVSSNLSRFDGIRFGKSRKSFGPEVKRRIILGTFALSSGYYDAYYKKALQAKDYLTQKYNEVFEKFDLIVTPTTATSAWNIGSVTDPLEMYLSDLFTVTANVTSLPAISVPFGSEGKMPLSLHFTASYGREDLLFQIGREVEKYEI